MKNKVLTKIVKNTIFFSALGLSTSAYAGLERIGYVPVNDTNIKYIKPTERYVNPTASTIQLFVSAGLDRYINVYIINENNNKVFEKKSDLLTNSHRYVDPISGQEFLGEVVLVDANLPDGNYQIVTQLLGTENKIVSSETNQLTIDTTAPIFGSKIYTTNSNNSSSQSRYYQVNDPNNDFPFNALSGQSYYMKVSDVEELSGIKSAFFTSYHLTGDKAGQMVRTTPAIYDEELKEISISSVMGKLFSSSHEAHKDYRIELKVEDLAGNISTIDEIVGYPGTSYACPGKPVAVAAEVPGSENIFAGIDVFKGFEPFSSGGEVVTSPVRILYAVSNEYMYPNHKYGLTTKPFYQDAENSYYMETRRFGQKSFASIATTASGYTCATYSNTTVNFKGMDGKMPTMKRYEHKMEGFDIDVIPNNTQYRTNGQNSSFYSNQPLHWEYTKVNVNPGDFDINVRGSLSGKNYFCTIPAGETSCDLVINKTIDNMFQPTSMSVFYSLPISPDYYQQLGNSVVYYLDNKAHVLDKIIYEPENLEGNLYFYDEYAREKKSNNSYINYKSIEFDFIDETNKVHTLKPSTTTRNIYEWISTFKLSSLPHGNYILKEIRVTDTVDNIVRGTLNPSNIEGVDNAPFVYLVDKKGPEVVRLVNNEATEPNDLVSLSTLDDLKFKIIDDSEYEINYVTVRGGFNDERINLAHRYDEQGNVVLEYPILFPTLTENEIYYVDISVTDSFKNNSVMTSKFRYDPTEIVLSNNIDGKLYIPAKTEEFFHSNGNRALETETLRLSDGSAVQGSYDVFATVRGDSTVPLVINGEYVEPGKTVEIITQHDFSLHDGKLSIPLSAALDGIEGEATMLIYTSAPNSPALVVNVATWLGQVDLISDTWSFRQIVEPFNIIAQPSNNTYCRFTLFDEIAKNSDPIKDPVCLLEWTQIPVEADPTTQEEVDEASTVVGLTGHGYDIGETELRYQLFIYNGLGNKVFLSEGLKNIEITSAFDSIGFKPSNKELEFKRAIEDVEIKFHQVFGPECRLTLDENRAIKSWSLKNSKDKFCFFQWQSMPSEIVQNERFNYPITSGKIQEIGEYPLAWELSVYSLNGEKVIVSQDESIINVINPRIPSLSLDSPYQIKEDENAYAVPIEGGYLGLLRADVDDGDITITSSLGNQIINKLNFFYSPRRKFSEKGVNSSIPFLNSSLNDRNVYTAEVAYKDVPEISASKDFIVYTVPQNTIRPEINVDREAVSTDLLPVSINMVDSRFSSDGYSKDTMGDWEARVVIPQGRNEPDRVLTDYMPMIDGLLTTEIDIEEFSQSRTLQLQAEARWVHNIPDYEHVVKSRSLSRVNLLSGLPIDANLTARRISGEAPFTTIFSLSLNNANDRNNIETVEWQESSDGSNWQTIPMDFPDERKLTRTFNEGTHYVRAVITNKHSGFKSQTELIEVVAYQVVEAEIEGSLAHFVGSNATFKLNPFVRIEPTDEQKELIKRGQLDYDSVSKQYIDLDTVNIEWTTDRWKTIAMTGNTISISSDEPSRSNLEARIKPIEAPEDDYQSYRHARATVSFNNPSSPLIRISGNKRLELGVEHTFQIRLSAPFRNLSHDMAYEIIYPNGEIETAIVPASEGDIVNREFKYSLTEEDNEAGRVSFVVNAHIVGFEEETKTTALFSPQTWQYVFPNFFMTINRTTAEAPAEVNVSVSPSGNFRGSLEDPTYEWKYPDNFEVIRSRSDTTRTFQVNEAGEYEIEVTVRDARGNEAVIKESVQLIEPKPFNVNLRTYPSNRYNREPLDVSLRAFISGGHPLDRLRNYNLEINGQESLPIGHLNVTGLNAGSNTITLKGLSEMGVAVEESVQIDVNANKRPVCEPITGIRNSRAISVTAHCRDEDGQLVNYEWRINGQLLESNSRRFSYRIDRDAQAPKITLQVTDDSGAKSEVYSVNIK